MGLECLFGAFAVWVSKWLVKCFMECHSVVTYGGLDAPLP